MKGSEKKSWKLRNLAYLNLVDTLYSVITLLDATQAMSGFTKLLSPKGKLWIVELLVGVLQDALQIDAKKNAFICLFFF